MPDPETMIREACERFGWKLRELPAIPREDGFIEIRTGRVFLKAVIPREPELGYDPWDALYQACAALTFPHD